ncbi:TPA: heparinase [Candidatus Marinimicrobia bacterium]|nr:heparinase [Candidatus Neomarinimicrobiota bacterium]
MKFPKLSAIILFFSLTLTLFATKEDRIPEDNFVFSSLKETAGLRHVRDMYNRGDTNNAWLVLADSLKERSRNRYYFDWFDFSSLIEEYSTAYPGIFEDKHRPLAEYHISRYAPETHWKLPFKNLLGEDVTAYELRHLARQQKSTDMTLVYFYDKKKEYLDYWTRQVANLMQAYEAGEYDDEGNGIFEYYRAGRRIHNWLFNHHAYYHSPDYTVDDQKLLIQTFIYHGFDLAERTRKFNPGNHHTKGLVALFEMAIFLQDFTFSDVWIEQSLKGLTEHMRREINEDGFQFERSVHYHFGDIENYLRVYQLAQINDIPVPELFEKRFKELFEVLVKIAQPDKNLPVLQDDTDHFLKEVNDLGGIFKAGSLLLQDPVLEYFAADYPDSEWFWLLARMLRKNAPEAKRPEYGSLALESTGYYIMRSGWGPEDAHMSISAGLSAVKPDHQHGDMLGLTAYAGENQILPTYQVKYNKPDYPLFKNSWVKNVAIVDSIPHGRDWKGNTGGSGFGKFLTLPKPKTLIWKTGEDLDIYVGTHDGYKELNVETYRTVLFFKQLKEWVVCDLFLAPENHQYQQIWQQLDSAGKDGSLSRVFTNGMTFAILQKNPAGYETDMKKLRDKRSWMVSTNADTFQFVSHLSYRGESDPDREVLKWGKLPLFSGINISDDAGVVMTSGDIIILFGIKTFRKGNLHITSVKPVNLILHKKGFRHYDVMNISPYAVSVNGSVCIPGQIISQE